MEKKTKIDIVKADVDGMLIAIYIDGKISTQGDEYYFDLEYGFNLKEQYPNSELILHYRQPNLDWLEDLDYQFPDTFDEIIWQ